MSITSIVANALKIPSLQLSVGAKSVAKSPDRVTILADNLKNMSQLIGGERGAMAGPAKQLQALANKLAEAPSRHAAYAALKEVYNIRQHAAAFQRGVSDRGASGSWNDTAFQKYGGIRRAAEGIMQSPHLRMQIDGSAATDASAKSRSSNKVGAMLNPGPKHIPGVLSQHTGPVRPVLTEHGGGKS